MKRRTRVGALGSFLLLVAGCSSTYADGPYRARVVDLETKQPIQGAAVVAVWVKESGILVPHPIETIEDVQETVTDENGEFVFESYKGTPPGPFEELGKPIFTIFKPSYQVYGHGGLPKTLVVELRPWKPSEQKERRLRLTAPPSWCYGSSTRLAPHLKNKNNCPNMFRLVNLERKALGLTGELYYRPEGEKK